MKNEITSNLLISMRKRKFLIGCLIFVIVGLAIFNKSRAVVSQTSDFYVNDSAGVLDNSLKNYIISTNKSLYSQTGAQIVVVTVNSLDGDAIEDYANKLFRQYEIGDSKKNNGVLILLSIQDRKCRIEVGYGLEGTLTDGKTGRIQDDYMVPYFKNDNWQDGIKNGYNAVLEEVKNEYNVTINGSVEAVKGNQTDKYDKLATIFAFSILPCSLVSLFSRHTKKIIRWISAISSILSFIMFMFLDNDILLMIFMISGLLFLITLGSGRGGYYGGGYGGGGFSSGSSGGSFGGGGSSGGGGSARSL